MHVMLGFGKIAHTRIWRIFISLPKGRPIVRGFKFLTICSLAIPFYFDLSLRGIEISHHSGVFFSDR